MKNEREKISLNGGWSFHAGDLSDFEYISHDDIYNSSKAGGKKGAPARDFDDGGWKKVNVPHDYIIEQNTDEKAAADWGYRRKNNAWYRKSLILDGGYEGNRIVIGFEGVATECTVYFNGSVVKRNYSGYNSFEVDITDRAALDGTPNILAVYINGKAFEGWWYEGAGIYRNVWLNILPPVHFAEEPYIICEKVNETDWAVTVTGAINGDCSGKKVTVKKIITDYLDNVTAEFETQSHTVKDPFIWDINSPALYRLTTRLYIDGVKCDSYQSIFGFRTIEVSADKGFFLNGRHVKIKGTCNHQDFAGLGTAVPDSVWEYKIQRLRAMGCNSYRSAHGTASEGLLKACDKYGVILMDENRNFETSEECLEQLRTMVKRDRNHPSVVFYSLFNEEPIQGTPQGKNMTLHMIKEIRRLDGERFITGAVNEGILNENGVSALLDIAGINYQINEYDNFHKKFEKLPVIATETNSSFQVRGCTKTNNENHTFSCYDEDAAGWGNTVRETWEAALTRDFITGAFTWTGFDYLGEPTPHTYPSVSSFFGMMDTCGFEKGGFYLTKALWSDNPYVHVLPHWNFEEGEDVRVMSCTNCEEAELFINGKSQGKVRIDKFKQHTWDVKFETGDLKLVGYNKGIEVKSCVKKTAGAVSKILLTPAFDAFSGDITAIPVTVTAADENGTEVPYADNILTLSVSGGVILGTGNGDPNCHENFKGKKRSLFAGKAMVIIAANKGMQNVMLKVSADGLNEKARLVIPVQ